jgi:hypothetical protein
MGSLTFSLALTKRIYLPQRDISRAATDYLDPIPEKWEYDSQVSYCYNCLKQ